jgi:hypothetical protein
VTGKGKPPIDPATALIGAFRTNERINQLLIDLLEPKLCTGAWITP